MKALTIKIAIPLLALISPAPAQEAQLTIASANGGQSQLEGGAFTLDASFDPIGQQIAQSADGSVVTKSGFVAQITDPRSLALSVPDLDEGSSTTPSATATLDDDTTDTVPVAELQWGTVSGAVFPVNLAGLVRARTVFQGSSASISASWFGIGAVAGFTVRNTGGDDVEPVAGDGIDDAWQFLHFDADADGKLVGEEASDAQPDADPDGDDQHNLYEFLAGYDPRDAESNLEMEIVSISDGTVTIELSKVIAGTRYTLLSSPDLGIETDWTMAAEPVSGIDQEAYQFTDSSARRNFYRLRLEPVAP